MRRTFDDRERCRSRFGLQRTGVSARLTVRVVRHVWALPWLHCESDGLDRQKSKGGEPGRLASLGFSPRGESPASLAGGGLPVVCWPTYSTLLPRKKLRGSPKK